MTENERLTIDEIIQHCNRHTERMEQTSSRMQLEKTPIGNSDRMKQYWEHRQVAEWLEEIQQYRAIGTVEEIQQKLKNMSLVIDTDRDLLNRYIAIGTIEEFKNLKEKSEPKKIKYEEYCGFSDPVCPECKRDIDSEDKYCRWCGQTLKS